MNPQTDKLVRRTTMVGTVVAAYLLLTADYGPQPNVLDPIRNAILSGQRSVKDFILGTKKKQKDSDTSKADTNGEKRTP
ncbi:uncharacterized protein LOC141605121 [Silene latifolia]|uniref:uncharacterized protein LOC141605121 n=1 Tax=Silene latifolia TaxID=37657 RepID=UPI003D7701C2